MAEVLACPESAQLAKIALGHLPDANAAALIEHIAKCSHCAARLQSVVAEDSLVDAVRSKESIRERPEDDAVRRLLEKVRGLISETKGHQTDQTRDLPASLSNENTPNFSWVDSPDQPAQEDDGLAPPKNPDEIGRLGPYRVLKVLGEGGMGKVFLAEDPALQRSVALKVMKPSLARNKTSVLRFQQEARAAAAIEHDNIIPIYQVGEDRGVPFVAMPLLKGASLDDLLRKAGALQLKQALRIGIQIAEGLAAAHERKLIHRDIKPGNIWIEPTGGGRVKILDFGLARSTEGDTNLTQSGAIMGTPAYMPPEQARGEKVDHRADLYSLGCVVYRMATGELPLKGNDTMGMLMALAIQEPTAPRLVKPDVPQALSDVIMKLLAKDPAQRFASAREVVVALKAVENGTAKQANSDTAILSQSLLQPPTELPMAKVVTQGAAHEVSGPAHPLASRAAPSKRRRPRVLIALAAAALVLLFGAGGVIYRFSFQTADGTLVVEVADEQAEVAFKKGKLEIRDPKTREVLYTIGASEKNKKLPPGEYLIEVKGSNGLELSTDKFTLKKNGEEIVTVRIARPAIAQAGPDAGIGKTAGGDPVELPRRSFATLDHLDPAKIPAEERFDWQPKELVAVIGNSRGRHWGGNIAQLEFSPDGKTITCLGGGPVSLFDADTLRLKALLPSMSNVAFSADHKIMVTSNYGDGIWLWDANGPELKKRARIGTWNSSVLLSSDGKTLVEGHTREIRLWDLSEERAMRRAEIKDLKHDYPAMALAPNGKTLAIAHHEDNKVQLWDLTGAQPQERNALPSRNNSRPEFSPDSKILAIPGANNDTELWNLNGAKPQKQASVPGGGIAVFSRDGKKLAVCGGGDRVFLYDLAGPEPVPAGELRCFAHRMALSPDGKTLATGREFGLLQLWDLTELKERIPLEGHPMPLRGALASPDGKWVATFSGDCLCIWDMSGPTPRLRTEHKKDALSASFSPDSKTLATSDNYGTALLWDLTTAEPEIRTKILPDKALQLHQITFAPDGKTLALYDHTGLENRIRLWDVSGDEPIEKFVLPECQGPFAFLPNGKRLVSGTDAKNWLPESMQLWDLTAKTPTKIFNPFGGPYKGLAVAPDGKTLTCYDQKKGMTTWDVSGAKPKERAVFEDPDFDFFSNTFGTPTYAPDGKTLAFASGKIVSLWDVTRPTAKHLRKWQFPGAVAKASFAPDGRHLITANANGTAYVLRLAPSPDAKKP